MSHYNRWFMYSFGVFMGYGNAALSTSEPTILRGVLISVGTLTVLWGLTFIFDRSPKNNQGG